MNFLGILARATLVKDVLDCYEKIVDRSIIKPNFYFRFGCLALGLGIITITFIQKWITHQQKKSKHKKSLRKKAFLIHLLDQHRADIKLMPYYLNSFGMISNSFIQENGKIAFIFFNISNVFLFLNFFYQFWLYRVDDDHLNILKNISTAFSFLGWTICILS